MDWNRVTFEELSQIEWQAWMGEEEQTGWTILRLAFSGECGFGCKSNPDASYMTAIATSALLSWAPMGVVLDLRELTYEWGDEMASALGFAGEYYAGGKPVPTVAIVSDRCRGGLTSLVAQEMGADPAKWLFEDEESALKELCIQMNSSYGRGNTDVD